MRMSSIEGKQVRINQIRPCLSLKVFTFRLSLYWRFLRQKHYELLSTLADAYPSPLSFPGQHGYTLLVSLIYLSSQLGNADFLQSFMCSYKQFAL